MSQDEKDKIKEYHGQKYQELVIRLNKKEFHKSKEPIDLISVNIDQIFVSDKLKDNNEGFKYFISYLEGRIVKPLCIILPQMTGYIK